RPHRARCPGARRPARRPVGRRRSSDQGGRAHGAADGSRARMASIPSFPRDPRPPAPRRGPRAHLGAHPDMISTGELKKGVAIELDGELWQILDYHHIKMGRGSAQVRITLRNIKRGQTVERSFQAGTKWPRASMEK